MTFCVKVQSPLAAVPPGRHIRCFPPEHPTRPGRGREGRRLKPWPEALRGGQGEGWAIPAPKKLAPDPRRVHPGRIRPRGGPHPGLESPPTPLRRLRPGALDDDAGRVGGLLEGFSRQVSQCQGVVFEPSVWRSTRTPFSYFSRMIFGTGFLGWFQIGGLVVSDPARWDKSTAISEMRTAKRVACSNK